MLPLLLLNKGFYIPAGIVVNGDFVSEKDGAIEGTINGDVKLRALTVEKKGIINGDLHVTDLIVKGYVNGNIYCEGKVNVVKDAVVTGNIIAAESRIHKLSIVKGVISHLNPKRENRNTIVPAETVTHDTPTPGTIPENTTADFSIHLTPEDMLPDEPPQNWF